MWVPKDMWYSPVATLASPAKMRSPPKATVAVSAVPFLRYVGLSAPVLRHPTKRHVNHGGTSRQEVREGGEMQLLCTGLFLLWLVGNAK